MCGTVCGRLLLQQLFSTVAWFDICDVKNSCGRTQNPDLNLTACVEHLLVKDQHLTLHMHKFTWTHLKIVYLALSEGKMLLQLCLCYKIGCPKCLGHIMLVVRFSFPNFKSKCTANRHIKMNSL